MSNPSSAFPVTAGDINIYHARLIADQQVTYVVECAGSLEIDRVRRSLAVLHEAPPILSTDISVNGFHFQREQLRGYQPAGRVESGCEMVEMDAFKQAQPGLGAFSLMTLGAMRGGRILHDRYTRASTRGSRFINFTNFGILDEAQLRFDGVQVQQACGIGPIQYAPGILMALSTYHQTLHFVVQGNDTERFRRLFMGLWIAYCATYKIGPKEI